MPTHLNSSKSIRVNDKQWSRFEKKCARLGHSSASTLRRFITAFNDGRLKIDPTDAEKATMKETFNVT